MRNRFCLRSIAVMWRPALLLMLALPLLAGAADADDRQAAIDRLMQPYDGAVPGASPPAPTPTTGLPR